MVSEFRHAKARLVNGFLTRFERAVTDNYHDCEFRLRQMAIAMGMSERQLQRKLKRLIGRTPSEFVRSFRLSKSVELLLSGVTVRDTAEAVGFSSQAYFASCFKAEYGRTPTEYRDRIISASQLASDAEMSVNR